jgi:hypothetical protein
MGRHAPPDKGFWGNRSGSIGIASMGGQNTECQQFRVFCEEINRR